jgi:L-alanine-DL-glutamate epimerase-like enolase superfamily enzyme
VETEILADPANPQLLVHVADDDGMVGTGETWWGTYQPSAPPGTPVRPIASVIDELLTPICIGRSASDIADLWAHLHRVTYQYGPEGIISSAIAGIDLALWDLAGQRAGRPTADLLGARQHDRIPAYASLHWLGDADKVVADAGRAVEAGFRAVKLHEARADIVRAARTSLGPDINIMVDLSARLTEAETIELARACADCDLTWIEEPVFPQQDHDALARIRAAVTVPVAAGENEFGVEGFSRLLAGGAVDIAQLDPAKCGGLTPSVVIAELARVHDVAVSPHNFSLGPSLGANIHLAMVSPTARWIEVPFLPAGATFPANWPTPTLGEGMIPYPGAPGLRYT